jgi:hypothetical protein
MPRQMNVYYDTEFHEDGHTIDLISIGMVRADGKEFYAVSKDADYSRVLKNEWLMKNVMSSIDHELVMSPNFIEPVEMFVTDPAAMTREEIRYGITQFLSDVWPNLWAWYGAYDHVALCQLWGKMIDLPAHMPMFTSDLRQTYKELGNPGIPAQMAGKHNALDDARHNKVVYDYLMELKRA